MHILCPICSDLLTQTETIYVTKCGHMFHYHCLTQWTERSRTCPQCRQKLTNSCMFRLFLTVSNESGGEDVATLQSRLDDVLLKLREHRATCREHEDKAAQTEAELNKHIAIVNTLEKQLEHREATIAALKQQLEYVKVRHAETEKLKTENESLRKNVQLLNGLQKVLNATSVEVEEMLEGYSDVKTVATFATALKRALCESESKKNDMRDRLQSMKQNLSAEKAVVADLQSQLAFADEKLTTLSQKYKTLKCKRKQSVLEVSRAPDSPPGAKKRKPDLDAAPENIAGSNNSFNTMVATIENSDSPYLRLQQSSVEFSALMRATGSVHPAKPSLNKSLKPSEYALINSARNIIIKPDPSVGKSTSIFKKKEPLKISASQENDADLFEMNISYDGLGGHSRPDTFPQPNPNFKSRIPKLSTKHKLKRPTPAGSQDIGKMFQQNKNKPSDKLYTKK